MEDRVKRKRDYRTEYQRRKQLKVQRWQNNFTAAYLQEFDRTAWC